MYFIFSLLIQEAYLQCFQKQKEETLYLSSGETMKLDLQDYIYGKSLKYHSTIGCVDEKLYINNISLSSVQTSDYSGYTLCFDPITGVQLQQSIQYYVKGTQLTVQYYDLNAGSTFFFQRIRINLEKNMRCENIICLKLNESLIDCHSQQQRNTTFYLVNSTSQQYTTYFVSNQDYGQILGELPQKDIYYFYRIVNTKNNNDRLDQYKINTTSSEISYSTLIDMTTYNVTGLTLFNFVVYNNGIYLLSKEKGLCYIRKSESNQYCWDISDQFDIFSIFIQQNGQHSIILGSTTSLEIFKAVLYDDQTFIITSLYNLRKGSSLLKVFHNQKFTLLLGQYEKKKFVVDVYTQLNDFTSNLYKVIENVYGNQQLFYFDSLSSNLAFLLIDQAITINNRSIIVATIQLSYLTISKKEGCYDDTIFITATQLGLELDPICEFTFFIKSLEEGSEDIYDVEEMNQSVVVLNKSINTFNLNNYVIGPNINYYLYTPNKIQTNENDFEKIYFKDIYYISYQQTIDPGNIIFNKAFPSQDGFSFDYYQIIQWSDLSIEIFQCSILDIHKSISCTYQQSMIMKNQIQQILPGFRCQSGCFAIRQNTKVILYMEINNKFVETNCSLEYQFEIETITYIKDNYITILQNNIIQIYQGNFHSDQCILNKVYEINSTQLEKLVNVSSVNIFNVRTNFNMFNLYISTNVGLIIIDPGLLRFKQTQLLWFVKFNEQFDTVLQIINNRIVRLNYTQINIIHLMSSQSSFYEKILPIFNYTITNTTNSQVGLERDLLYIQARDSNQNDVIIVYKLDQQQVSTFHTIFSKVNKKDFNVLQKKSSEFFLIQVTQAQKLYTNVYLEFKSSQSEQIKLLFSGFLDYAKMMDLKVNVKTSEKQYNLSLLINTTQIINYTNSKEEYIKLETYNDFIDGSVSEWSITCGDCPDDIQLINNVNFNSNLTSIPNTTQIKHTYDYVLIQQEQNIIAIDGKGKAKYLIQLPIPDPQTKCTSITASVQDLKTKLVVSVCNTTQQASFYITSFLSSFPTPIGPFYSPILIHQITHIRMMNDLLFILDVVTEYVYIFNLTVEDIVTDQLRISVQLNAREFTADQNQVFVSFDVAYQNSTYMLILVTNTSQLILFMYPEEDAYSCDLIVELQQLGYLDLPSNIIPQSLMVADYGKRQDNYYYRIIVSNLNYHHFELEILLVQDKTEVVVLIDFIRAYMQYGYYYASGKIRVSEDSEGFFGLIYQSPLDETKKMLAIYDRKNNNTEKLRKILGGYKIVSNNQMQVLYQIRLFDFLHYNNPKDEFSYGIILTDGALIQSLALSRYLALKIKNNEFFSQNMTFNASNDFEKWVSFKANIYNKSGIVNINLKNQPNFKLILIALGFALLFVIFYSTLYVKNKLRKFKFKIFPEEQVDETDVVKEEEKEQI